jgi:hypothetical protein
MMSFGMTIPTKSRLFTLATITACDGSGMKTENGKFPPLAYEQGSYVG